MISANNNYPECTRLVWKIDVHLLEDQDKNYLDVSIIVMVNLVGVMRDIHTAY